MKKLFLMALCAAVAGLAQGAAVQWNSGSNSDGFADPDGNSLRRSSAYEMVVTFYTLEDGEYKSVGTSTSSSGTVAGAYSGTFSDYDFSAGGTYYATATISSSAKTLSTSDYAAFTVPNDDSNASINFTTGAGFATSGAKWASSGWTDTPEPTSGLLLLVGGALLGLRRKRA